MPWEVPKMWEGGECWIIGGGASLTEQFNIPKDIVQQVLSKELTPDVYSPYMFSIHSKHVIGVNAAFLIGDWIDMMFFGDARFFLEYRVRLAEFSGLKVTSHERPSKAKYAKENIKYLPKNPKWGKGISPNPSTVSWNGNSGAAAISVAVHTGVKRIILVGFDMKLNENYKQHWHGLYGTAGRKDGNPRGLPFHRHLLGFKAIHRDSLIRGVEILNACPGSAITQFRKVTVKELL